MKLAGTGSTPFGTSLSAGDGCFACELSKTCYSGVFNNAFRLAGESNGGASSSAVAETSQVHADVSQASFHSQVRVLRCASYCILCLVLHILEYIASPPGCVVPLDHS